MAGTDGTAVLADGDLLFWQFRDETPADDEERPELIDALAASIETLEIGLEKTDIRVAEAKLVWVPVK